MTTDREAFLASFKEYLATTPAVELLNDYTYLLIYINHDPYDEQETVPVPCGCCFHRRHEVFSGRYMACRCAKRQREDDNAFGNLQWHGTTTTTPRPRSPTA